MTAITAGGPARHRTLRAAFRLVRCVPYVREVFTVLAGSLCRRWIRAVGAAARGVRAPVEVGLLWVTVTPFWLGLTVRIAGRSTDLALLSTTNCGIWGKSEVSMGRGRSSVALPGAQFSVGVTSFVGRRREIGVVKRLLTTSRMVTLTGAGGVGKTRLALRVAAEVRRAFPDGVWLVELARLRDPDLLASTVITTLGPRDGVAGLSPVDCLATYLADKHVLLVLDNCEHLSAACAHLVARLLGAAPQVRVLATSREPLHIAAERVWPVPPLSVPGEGEDLGDHRYEALTLFADRASAVLPSFTLNRENEAAVAEVCRRLDGLPLAIELAAVWLRVLSPDQILSRMRDRSLCLRAGDRTGPERHQTLGTAADWSFSLCSPLEQTLWARASVFAGEFDLDTAEAVCAGDGLDAGDVLTGIDGLLGKSVLIRVASGSTARYRMLETIRQYGAFRLAASGEEQQVRRRHQAAMLALAARVEQEWCGPHQLRWYGYLRERHADLRAALRFSLTEPAQVQEAFQLLTVPWDYWAWYGLCGEGRRWLDQAVALEEAVTPATVRALWVCGRLAVMQGDMDAARSLLARCDALAGQAADVEALAHMAVIRGLIAFFEGDHSTARLHLEKAVEEFEQLSATASGACILALYELALVTCVLGDDEGAIEMIERSRALSEKRGTDAYRFVALAVLGFLWFKRGDLPGAAAIIKESLRIQRSAGEMQAMTQCLEVMAWITAAQDRHSHAAELLGAADMLWQQLGASTFDLAPYADFRQQAHARLGKALGDKAFQAAWQRGRRLSVEEAIACALEGAVPPSAASKTGEVLTRRQREVADLIADGCSNREIAAKLVISLRTAEGHVEKILVRLGFTSRAQIAAWAATQRAVELSRQRTGVRQLGRRGEGYRREALAVRRRGGRPAAALQ